jgi:hypothetical protein
LPTLLSVTNYREYGQADIKVILPIL